MFIKKNFKILLILIALFTVISCGGKTTTVEVTEPMGIALPNLVGMSRSEINGTLSNLGLTFVFKYETTTEVTENTFSRYGNDLQSGQIVSDDIEIVVYIATEDAVLPDLEGLTQQEIIVKLIDAGVTYTFDIITSNDVPDQTFSHYGLNLEAGDTVPMSFNVPVFIAFNTERLPDLTGKMIEEIKKILDEKNMIYDFNYIVNDDFVEDSFVSYKDYEIGDFYPEEKVTINLYKNTFTNAEYSLIISKYIDGGYDTDNQAIEIYNPTNAAIDLGDYHLVIYRNGSFEVTYKIDFDDVSLLPGETYVIANSDADSEILANADLASQDLLFDGNDTIQLRYLNDTYIDTIYQIGNRDFIFGDEVFVRLESVTGGTRSFTFNQWVSFVSTYTEILGTHPIAFDPISEITFQIINRDFDDPLGGMTEVTLVTINDGDTASFTPGFTDSERVRFLGIDTPETWPETEPWGLEAKAYTTLILNNAIGIYIQSDPDLGYTETYGRHLGLVWVNLGAEGLTIDILNSDEEVMRTEHLSGWILLNYHLVLNGYSYNYYSSDSTLVFNNRYLYRWFQYAEKFAKDNGLGIHE